MEYRNLVTFLRVAELQNFTKAANELGYAQSTVTFHIKTLEDELGVVLFDRIGRKVTLTDAGEYLVQYANELLKIQHEIDQLKNKSNEITGKLRVGVTESMLSAFMTDVIANFNLDYPTVDVEVTTNSSENMMEFLRSNDLDLAVVMGTRIVDPDFERVLIYPTNVSFVVKSDSPLAKKKHLTFAEAASNPLILPEKQSLYRQAAEEAAAEYDCILRPAIQINNTSAILRLVERGLGVSFLPEFLTRKEAEKGEISILDLEGQIRQKYFIQVLYHNKKWITPQMRRFIEVLRPVLENVSKTSAGERNQQ